MPPVSGGGQQEQWQQRLSRALQMVVDQEQEVFDQEALAALPPVPPVPPAPMAPMAPVAPFMAGGKVAKRSKKHFSEQEVQHLRDGVHRYGVGNWSRILLDPQLHFHETRNSVSLKDKWRNLMKA